MSVINEVKQKADIVEVISQYTALTKAGQNFRALCPFHGEKRPSFYVYPERQSWHCFGACATGGDVLAFIMKRENIDFGEALHRLAQQTGVTLPSGAARDARQDEQDRVYQANEAAARFFQHQLLNSPAGEKARDYLVSRSISSKSIADFQLGFSLNSWEALKQYLLEKAFTQNELLQAGLIIESEGGKRHDRFRNRLMFPISDDKGRITGFGARALDDSFPKYLNSPQTLIFDKSSTLYGINRAKAAIRQQSLAVIVEGYMDVITAHQNGFNNVVATLGTAVTESQVSTLKRLTRNIVLALDADTAGEEAMLRCVGYENRLEAEVKVVILPQGRDPDDVIKEDPAAWQNLLDNSLPAVDFTFNTLIARLDLNTARDKSLAVDRLLPVIGEIKNHTRRDHYLTRLAHLTGTSYRNLENTLGVYISRQKTRQTAPKKDATVVTYPVFSSPLEKYLLALLLQHPELKGASQRLQPEYFENSENREIFTAWQQASDLPDLKSQLDASLWEHLDALANRNVPANQLEQRYTDCVLNLRQKFLQNLEAKKAQVLALEAETGGTAAELARLTAEGIEPTIQLREVFNEKARKGQKQRR